MPNRNGSPRHPPEALQVLVEQSGLPARTFATVMGINHVTLWNCLNTKRGWITEERLNAARFALIQLGKPVSMPPVVLPKLHKGCRPYKRKEPTT